MVDATTRGLQASLTPATRMVWVETSPIPRCACTTWPRSLRWRARMAPSPWPTTPSARPAWRPLELGIDLVLHSMTKYLGGHGDATRPGGFYLALVGAVRKTGLGHVGGNLAPQEQAFVSARHQNPGTAAHGRPLRGAAAVAHDRRILPCAPCTTPACRATPSTHLPARSGALVKQVW
ncbi:MAG: PLP-dependent transferase [Burkholderiaceae bacterium]